MNTVRFGSVTDYRVPRLGLGCMSMSGSYGPQDDRECIATLRRALDLGINFLDTSHSYGEGHNQTLIGKALKGRREQVVIHSKTGSIRSPSGDPSRGGGAPEYLRKICEESLRRLGIDCLDILCLSRVDPNVPIEESVAAMAKMVKEGKTRYIALSEASPESIRRAWTVHPIASLQIEYSLFSRDPEVAGNIAAVRARGMGFMAYAPLGRGLLTGRFRTAKDLPDGDRRRQFPRFQAENIEKNVQILSRLRDLATEKGISLASLSLAWLLHRGDDIIPIPSSKTREHLEDNLRALAVALTEEDLSRIEEICPPGAAAGTRYPAKQMLRVNA